MLEQTIQVPTRRRKEFYVLTDNKSVTCLKKIKPENVDGSLLRWILKLRNFPNFEIIHIEKNKIADALSRINAQTKEKKTLQSSTRNVKTFAISRTQSKKPNDDTNEGTATTTKKKVNAIKDRTKDRTKGNERTRRHAHDISTIAQKQQQKREKMSERVIQTHMFKETIILTSTKTTK